MRSQNRKLTTSTMAKRVQVDPIPQAIEDLETLGVTVFPIYSAEEVRTKNMEVMHMVRNYPEFATSDIHPVMGAFGAHSTPSSYHHPTVQALRADVHHRFNKLVMPTLARNLGMTHWHQLFDRVCTRSPGSGSMGKETWHYDHCDDIKNSAIAKKQLTGGWVNLTEGADQYFYGVKGKFGTEYRMGGKYCAIPDKFHAELDALLEAQGGPIVVPSGHMVCFKPELAHKVNPGRTTSLGVRLYLGTVMMEGDTPLYRFGADRITANELGYTGSGQRPPTWSAMSWSTRPDSIERWSKQMQPKAQYMETVTIDPKGKGPNAGKSFDRVARFLIQPTVVYPYPPESLRIMLPMPL